MIFLIWLNKATAKYYSTVGVNTTIKGAFCDRKSLKLKAESPKLLAFFFKLPAQKK
jgi:hypothetical protein